MTDAALEKFDASFDPSMVSMNIELFSKCNLRCIGCSVAKPQFRDTRGQPNIDSDRLKDWIAGGVGRIKQLRLYHMGETWLHPRRAEFDSFVKEVDPKISLFTSKNGMPLDTEANLDQVIETQFDHVMFSIHGASQQSCERYMGRTFNFDRAIKVAHGLADRGPGRLGQNCTCRGHICCLAGMTAPKKSNARRRSWKRPDLMS